MESQVSPSETIIQPTTTPAVDPSEDNDNDLHWEYFLRTLSPPDNDKLDHALFEEPPENSREAAAIAAAVSAVAPAASSSRAVESNELRCREERCGCKKLFENKTKLDRHVAVVQEQFKCSEEDCPSAKNGQNPCFGTLSDLVRHGKETHGPNKHFCPWELCKRASDGFPRLANLKSHLDNIHDGKRPNEAAAESQHRSKRPRMGKGKARADEAIQEPAGAGSAATSGSPVGFDGTIDPRFGTFNAPPAPMVGPSNAALAGPAVAGPSTTAGFAPTQSAALLLPQMSAAEADDETVRSYRAEMARIASEDEADAFALQAKYEEFNEHLAKVRERQRLRSYQEQFVTRLLSDRVAQLRRTGR